jgi:nickel transport protein
VIPLKEIQDVAGTADPRKTASKKAEEQAEICDVTLGNIRQVVEEALDKRLKPVMKILVESRENHPTFRDIFGGIGYILGLVGVAAYFNYRRKSAEIEGKKTD